MSHILKLSEWESSSGRWHAADTSDLANMSAFWAHPMRLLGQTPQEYIEMLRDKYHASEFKFYKTEETGTKDHSLLLFSFEKYADAHKFVLDINRIARNKNFWV